MKLRKPLIGLLHASVIATGIFAATATLHQRKLAAAQDPIFDFIRVYVDPETFDCFRQQCIYPRQPCCAL